MPPRNLHSSDWVSYGRSFLMTLGLLFLALPCWIWEKQGDRSSEWSEFAWAMLYGFAALGVFFLMFALLASAKSVDKLADAASTHEASLLIMVIAAPVYFFLKWIARRR